VQVNKFSVHEQIAFFLLKANELLDVTAYGLRSDFLSPETMPKATVELALTKNRKLLLASVLGTAFLFEIIYFHSVYQEFVEQLLMLQKYIFFRQ